MQQSTELFGWVLMAPFGLWGILIWAAAALAPVILVIGLVKAIRARKKELERGEEDAARKY